jgi:DUF4097 and DUF4098 domain-containing protein YvlB
VDQHTQESVMTLHQFETHDPIDLYAEIDKGRIHVTAQETTETTVEVSGRDADDVVVEQTGRRISVITPRRRGGFFSGDSDLRVSIVLPTGSDVTSRTGSADLLVDGTIGSCHAKTGSGDIVVDHVSGPSQVESGSGDVSLNHVSEALRVKSGSGDIAVRHSENDIVVSTGSGDVEIGDSGGPTVVKTGSGDLQVGDAHTDVSLATGSGDLAIGCARSGKVTVKGASGDVRIGIPAGVPVWTDITTVSGSISSDLEGAGQPEDGADHIEVRAKTVSGDILLKQL